MADHVNGDSTVVAERVVWRDACTIESVGERLQQLKGAFRSGHPITLEMSGVSRIDTACLQLLVALLLDAALVQRTVRWEAASAAVREAAELAGVSTLLGLSVEPVGSLP